MPDPVVGSPVHYVMPDYTHLPAVVVKVWSAACVNLQVFLDSPTGTQWVTSASLGVSSFQNTWHWPEAS